MLEALCLFIGTIGGSVGVYYLQKEHLEKQVAANKESLDNYKDGFLKGYETKTGTAPYKPENTDTGIYYYTDEQLYEFEQQGLKKEESLPEFQERVGQI